MRNTSKRNEMRPAEPNPDQEVGAIGRIEIARIGGDIYINGAKKAFAVDFSNPPTANPQFETVEWLIKWAKIGLISRGHTVPHYPNRTKAEFEER